MGLQDMLLLATALPPVWAAARLWRSTRDSLDEIEDSWASRPRSGGAGASPAVKAVEATAFRRAATIAAN